MTLASTRRSLSKRRLRSWIAIYSVTRRAESHLREFLRVNYDTTLPRFDVLAALWRRPEGISMSELSRMLLVSNGNSSSVVERLVQDKLIERIAQKSDRRVVRIRLSDEGRKKFSEMADGHEQEINRLFRSLNEASIESLTEILGQVEKSLNAGRPASGAAMETGALA
ncbi:MAG: MarR family transcriptional regulator [Alphaproteobacteria bacterium]|nr:MarR family transcriptional regulator [Alphaproteobacteria bacterium]